MLKQLDAIHASHLQVSKCEVEAAVFGEFDCGFTRRRGCNVVSFLAEYHFKDLSLRLLVINDQNILSRHVLGMKNEGRRLNESKNAQPPTFIDTPFSVAGILIKKKEQLPSFDNK